MIVSVKLYQIHTGFYDPKDVSKGFYEGHTNLFVCAKDSSDARKKTACAISSGLPILPAGILSIIAVNLSSFIVSTYGKKYVRI